MEICKNCQAELTHSFCAHCGQPRALKRIDGQYVIKEISSALSFDKGFFYTIRELAINPGENVKAFLKEDRNRLVKPIVFLIITSLIYTLFNNIFQFEDGYINFTGEQESFTLSIFNWVQGNYGYANIIMALFIGAWTKLFFRKHAFNFFEILVLLCFIMGMGMLVYSVFGTIQSLIDYELMQLAGIVGFIYLTWAMGQFFGKDKFVNYLKAFSAYLLGMLTFTISLLLIGSIIDFLV